MSDKPVGNYVPVSSDEPVYQARMLFENMFCECEEDQFAKLKELDNCETRILYPASAYEAQVSANEQLKAENEAQANRIEFLEAKITELEKLTFEIRLDNFAKEVDPKNGDSK